MKKFKGTKGKWELTKSDSVVLAPSKSICALTKHSESKFNAKLISRAPELLKACIMNCEADNTFKLSESRIMMRKLVMEILK